MSSEGVPLLSPESADRAMDPLATDSAVDLLSPPTSMLNDDDPASLSLRANGSSPPLAVLPRGVTIPLSSTSVAACRFSPGCFLSSCSRQSTTSSPVNSWSSDLPNRVKKDEMVSLERVDPRESSMEKISRWEKAPDSSMSYCLRNARQSC